MAPMLIGVLSGTTCLPIGDAPNSAHALAIRGGHSNWFVGSIDCIGDISEVDDGTNNECHT